MAWTAPLTWTANSILTAALLNTHLRDNLKELEPHLATVVGGYFVSQGANSIVQRVPAKSFISTLETTASAAFVDLATVGPAVTVTTGTTAIVFLRSQMSHSVINDNALASYAVSGATTIAAADGRGLIHDGHPAAEFLRYGIVDWQSGLTPGSNTFTMKYRTSDGATASFSRRFIAVLPL